VEGEDLVKILEDMTREIAGLKLTEITLCHTDGITQDHCERLRQKLEVLNVYT
jgi:hypothetical protein